MNLMNLSLSQERKKERNELRKEGRKKKRKKEKRKKERERRKKKEKEREKEESVRHTSMCYTVLFVKWTITDRGTHVVCSDNTYTLGPEGRCQLAECEGALGLLCCCAFT